jgi:hypothetical protein
MCLRREKGSPFSSAEVTFVQRIAPHIAEGLRLGLLARELALAPPADAPGLVATVLREQYLPQAHAGREPGAGGYYTGSSAGQPAGSK